MTSTKTKETTTEIPLHPFVMRGVELKDAKMMGLREFDNGIDAYLSTRNYHILPGGLTPIEIWESHQVADRFTIVARYPHVVIVVQVPTTVELQTFMTRYMPVAAILPEVLLPPQQAAPNNHRMYYK